MENNILVSITGCGKEYLEQKPERKSVEPWQAKLKAIEALGLEEIGLFLELYNKEEKQEIYDALLKSRIKSIPLVHIRHDMGKNELEFLQKNFKSKYFTIHEISFSNGNLQTWNGFEKNLYLEMGFKDMVDPKTNVEAIGGFCVDLAHFKVAMEKKTKEFEYVLARKNKKIFVCNHLGGWDPKINKDMHTIYDLKNFDYLKTLPKFVFGECITLEIFNPIKEQLEFKKYLERIIT